MVYPNGGLYLLLFVIFAETGLFVGFFLPGDSLLFVAGIYASELASEFFNVHYVVIMFMLAMAGVLGNFVGYWFGKNQVHLFMNERILSFSRKSTCIQRKNSMKKWRLDYYRCKIFTHHQNLCANHCRCCQYG